MMLNEMQTMHDKDVQTHRPNWSGQLLLPDSMVHCNRSFKVNTAKALYIL